MSLIYHANKSGLVLAEQAGDESGLQRALKDLDPDLILTWEVDERYQTRVWKVLAWAGDDRPAVHILDWREHGTGRPLPLTSRILDAVNEQRKDRPGGYDASVAADEANARLVAERRREFDSAVDTTSDDYEPYIDRGRVTYGFADTRPMPRYMRNRHLPDAVRRRLP
jgi:hypothetical protein